MTTAARTPITATMTRATRNSKTRIIPEFSEASLRHTLGVCFRRRLAHTERQRTGSAKNRSHGCYLLAGWNAIRAKQPPCDPGMTASATCVAASPRPWVEAGNASDDAQLECLQHRTRAVTHAELGQDVGNVVLDRALGHLERIGDLLVAVTAGQQSQDLGLALGERIGLLQAGELVLHPRHTGISRWVT